MPVSREVARAVQRRAGYRCEYCQVYGWPLTLDHIVPRSRGGGDDPDNHAAACFPCNRLKWDRVEAEDALTGEIVRLFHPRTDRWGEHFAWSPDFLEIRGITATARATAQLLRFNRVDRRRQRRVLRSAARSGGPAWP